jgi:Mn2+/Fe2+ NRAMP family transporter
VKRSKTPTPIWYRILFLFVGIFWLFWLSIEDLSERWVLLFAVVFCVLIALCFIIAYSTPGVEENHRNLHPEDEQSTRQFLYYPIVGALTGLAVTPMALFLMALKTGLHGHFSPEFSSTQVITVLFRTPIWFIGGFLIGLGMSLVSWSQKDK